MFADAKTTNLIFMRKILMYAMLFAFASTTFVSCSDDDDFNPFEHQTIAEFNPNEITFRKGNDNMDIVERWSKIVRNNKNKIVSYEYTREVRGSFTETETRSCTIDYFTNHTGNEVIRTNTEVEYFKSSNGIDESYTEKVQENISLNKEGYIESISTTTDHYAKGIEAPVTTTSLRTFAYKNNVCEKSTYNDGETHIAYKYNWNAYQLKNITILKENSRSNTIEYNTYDYTFDTRDYYKYSGTEIMPFVQSGLPQIFASMGYMGKCTPYILTGEVQGGYTKFAGITSENPQIRNSYNFDVEPGNSVVYSGISNIYNNYSITFNK